MTLLCCRSMHLSALARGAYAMALALLSGCGVEVVVPADEACHASVTPAP
jgi:hypothetical protein